MRAGSRHRSFVKSGRVAALRNRPADSVRLDRALDSQKSRILSCHEAAFRLWDTHFFNFPQLKKLLMPPFDHAASALLDDLAERGTLEHTLVLLLTEFGRRPLINKAARRDHSPDCYSVAFAGGGIQGGQLHDASDRVASAVQDSACGPSDLHATVFHALGIPGHACVLDDKKRAVPLTNGQRLPLF